MLYGTNFNKNDTKFLDDIKFFSLLIGQINVIEKYSSIVKIIVGNDIIS